MLRTVFAFLVTIIVSSLAQGADWTAADAAKEITAVTINRDGSERRTTIWVVVLGAQAYVRTSGTRWEQNLRRTPQFVLEIDGESISVESSPVLDRERIDRVLAEFRRKYGGFADGLARTVRLLTGGGSHVYKISLRRPRTCPNKGCQRYDLP